MSCIDDRFRITNRRRKTMRLAFGYEEQIARDIEIDFGRCSLGEHYNGSTEAETTDSAPTMDLTNKGSPRRRVGWHSLLRLAEQMLFVRSAKVLILFGILFRVSVAVFVPFDNCLAESYKYNDPAPLQWVPMFVDAAFHTTGPKHTLRVIMWGNVTGSSTNVELPPPGSPNWADESKTDGKILDEPDPGAPNPKLTTLHRKIEVLTYEPWSSNTNFCQEVGNGSCPLAPVFGANSRLAASFAPDSTVRRVGVFPPSQPLLL